MRSNVPRRQSPDSDSSQCIVIRHLVFVKATLLDKIAIATPYPMTAVDLFARNKPSFCEISPRVFILRNWFGIFWGQFTCSNYGVDPGLLLRQNLFVLS